MLLSRNDRGNSPGHQGCRQRELHQSHHTRQPIDSRTPLSAVFSRTRRQTCKKGPGLLRFIQVPRRMSRPCDYRYCIKTTLKRNEPPAQVVLSGPTRSKIEEQEMKVHSMHPQKSPKKKGIDYPRPEGRVLHGLRKLGRAKQVFSASRFLRRGCSSAIFGCLEIV